MPEHLRSLIYIILLALVTFYLAKKITASAVKEEQFNRWRNTWLALTLIVFLAGNFWVYAIASSLLLLYVGKKENNAFALFLVLLFAVPRIKENIPGMGIVNYLFAIDYVMILSFTVLLPAYLSLRRDNENAPFFSFWTDKLLMAYMTLDVVLLMRDTTITDAMRDIVVNFTDVFLPYYVASRSIKNIEQFKEAIAAFVIAALLVGVLGMFEYSRFWLLYANLKTSLGVDWAMGSYLGRGDSLRALATLGQPIILGYVMVIGLGCYLFLAKQVQSRWLRWAGWLILLGGLYVPISRGPWVGTAVLFISFVVISPNAMKNLTKLAMLSILTIPLLGYIPGGQKVMDMLPFIGKTDTENVDYRVKLIDSAYIVFSHQPIFGQFKFNDDLAALGMTQGEGIVDVVNTYLFEVLEHGLAGLTLFVSFFIVTIFRLSVAIPKPSDQPNDTHLLGRALLASLIATLVTITTVSSILVLPVIYWLFCGISVAYCTMLAQLEKRHQIDDFKSFRLAFDVMPALPVSKLAFSSLTTHRVVVDNKPIPRIVLTSKTKNQLAIKTNNDSKNTISSNSTQVKPVIKSAKPQLGSLYELARKNRPTDNAAYFEKTILLPVKPKVNSVETVAETGMIKVLTGSNAGRELVLNKVLTKLGKTNVQVAVISKRANGYFISHLEGKTSPIVNGSVILERAYQLKNQDMIEILGIKMQFFSAPTQKNLNPIAHKA